jgi:hypothetical protein
MAKKSIRNETQDIEFEPDAWQRFERAVDVVSKSPPQHRVEEKPKAKKAVKKKQK